MKAWPSTLPNYSLRDGYQSGSGDGRARSATDSGVAKLRRRFSATPRSVQVRMPMTDEQLATLKTFIAGDIVGGTLPFTFPSIEVPGETWIVQFGQNMPTWVPGDLIWYVTLDLVILP